jgi:hypothetical protein
MHGLAVAERPFDLGQVFVGVVHDLFPWRLCLDPCAGRASVGVGQEADDDLPLAGLAIARNTSGADAAFR